MPTVADILAILNWDPTPRIFTGPEYKVSNSGTREKPKLTDEQKKEIEEIMANARKTLESPKMNLSERGKQDYSHWDKMSAEQQKKVLEDMPKALKRLRASQPITATQ